MSEVAFQTSLAESELKISPAAAEQLKNLISSVEEDIAGIRIFVSGGGCSGMTYGMTYAESIGKTDKVLEGDGFKVAMSALDSGRMGIAAQALGLAQGALDAALQYAHERQQFGRFLKDFQAIQFKLADMQTRIDASRLLLHRAAAVKDAGKRFSQEAAMAKLYCSETAMYVTNEAVQIHGGYGYTPEYPVERMMRDAKITEIYEGTSEIQRIVIAANLLRDWAKAHS